MRIAYDHQIFQFQTHGGISRYFFELATRLPGIAGDEAFVAAPLHVNAFLPNAKGVLGAKVKAIPKTTWLRRMANGLVRPLIMHALSPDIVHETYYSSAPAAFRPRGFAGTVLTVYDMIHEKFPESFPARDTTARRKMDAVRRADHVICISHSTRADLIELLDVDESKVSVTHLGFSLAPVETGSNRRPAGHEPFLFYVGLRGGYKNFERFLRAYAASERLKRDFCVTAFGGGALTARERSLVRELGLAEDRVRQMGGGDDVLAGLYAEAAALIYPSLYEGFGLPPLEAMSHDCPAICARSSSIPEVAGDAAEYFDPCSVEDMTGAMENVLYSTARRDELINLGRRRVELFTWDACARRTRDIYASLL